MPKYLFTGTYSVDGAKGLVKDGGTKRRAVIEKMVGELGGTVEAFYFTFGEHDVLVIVDLPDNETAAAIALTVAASGSVGIDTTVLLTPEEVDASGKKSVSYKPPGS